MTHVAMKKRLFVASLGVLLLGSLMSGCAPEPNEVPEDHAQDDPGSSWSEITPEEEKVTTLPDSFPSDEIKLPDDIKIDNAGTRGESTWFVSLQTEDLEAAAKLRDQIAKDSQFTVEGDATEASDGGEQLSYLSPQYFVDTLTQKDGDSALLNIDIDRATG